MKKAKGEDNGKRNAKLRAGLGQIGQKKQKATEGPRKKWGGRNWGGSKLKWGRKNGRAKKRET